MFPRVYVQEKKIIFFKNGLRIINILNNIRYCLYLCSKMLKDYHYLFKNFNFSETIVIRIYVDLDILTFLRKSSIKALNKFQ